MSKAAFYWSIQTLATNGGASIQSSGGRASDPFTERRSIRCKNGPGLEESLKYLYFTIVQQKKVCNAIPYGKQKGDKAKKHQTEDARRLSQGR